MPQRSLVLSAGCRGRSPFTARTRHRKFTAPCDCSAVGRPLSHANSWRIFDFTSCNFASLIFPAA